MDGLGLSYTGRVQQGAGEFSRLGWGEVFAIGIGAFGGRKCQAHGRRVLAAVQVGECLDFHADRLAGLGPDASDLTDDDFPDEP